MENIKMAKSTISNHYRLLWNILQLLRWMSWSWSEHIKWCVALCVHFSAVLRDRCRPFTRIKKKSKMRVQRETSIYLSIIVHHHSDILVRLSTHDKWVSSFPITHTIVCSYRQLLVTLMCTPSWNVKMSEELCRSRLKWLQYILRVCSRTDQ